jgi:Domain of unknown function (DUF3854)
VLPTLDGRRVFICFDSDAVSKPDVGLAERRLTNFLRQHGAWVAVIRLPAGDDGAKVGIDDYLAAHGIDALDALAQQAEARAIDTNPDEKQLRARLRQYQEQMLATAALLAVPNADLLANDKLVVLAEVQQIGAHMAVGGASFVQHHDRTAKATGLSVDTVGKSIARWCDAGLFAKELRKAQTASGQFVSELRLTPCAPGSATEQIKMATTMATTKRLKYTTTGKMTGQWGGARQCPEHPDAPVIRRVTHSCSVCLRVLDSKETTAATGPQDAARLSDGEHSPCDSAEELPPTEGTSSPPPTTLLKSRRTAAGGEDVTDECGDESAAELTDEDKAAAVSQAHYQQREGTWRTSPCGIR